MNTKYSRSGSSEISELATLVRTVRVRHAMTQADLAGLSGTGLRFISELERGKPTVALNKVMAVMAVLGLRIRVEDATS